MSIYDDLRDVASEVFAEFKQGNIVYRGLTRVEGATPDAPAASVPVNVTLNATAAPVSTRFVDGSNIVQSDIQVAFANDGSVTPNMSDHIVIDGTRYKIVQIMAMPAAGNPVSWLVIVRR